LKAQVHATLAKQGRLPAASDVLARPPQWLVGVVSREVVEFGFAGLGVAIMSETAIV
jgi:hypothetical protein